MGNLPLPQMVWILWGNGKQTLDQGNLHKLFIPGASLGSTLTYFSTVLKREQESSGGSSAKPLTQRTKETYRGLVLPGQPTRQLPEYVHTCVQLCIVRDSNDLSKKKKQQQPLYSVGVKKKSSKNGHRRADLKIPFPSPPYEVSFISSCFCQEERALCTFLITLRTCRVQDHVHSSHVVLAACMHSSLLPSLKGARHGRAER